MTDQRDQLQNIITGLENFLQDSCATADGQKATDFTSEACNDAS
jgi:hypothetical protein